MYSLTIRPLRTRPVALATLGAVLLSVSAMQASSDTVPLHRGSATEAKSPRLDDGTETRDAEDPAGDRPSPSVNSTFERGSGEPRRVTCIDASGAVVNCP